jgi:Ca-activated chloride channel family protein
MDEQSQREQPSRITKDHPFLTAYALGEADEDMRRQVEAALLADPSLLETIEEIRSAGQDLEAALSLESFREEREMAEAEEHPKRRHHLLRFPALYFVIGSVSAACFAVVVALHVSYSEVVLRPGLRPVLAGALAPAPVPAQTDATLRDEGSGLGVVFKLNQTPEPGNEKGTGGGERLADTISLGLDSRKTNTFSASAPQKPGFEEQASTLSGSRTTWGSVAEPAPVAATPAMIPQEAAPHADSSPLFCYGGGTSMRVFDTEDGVGDRPFVATAMKPNTQLGMDVGAASYARLRRSLVAHQRPASEDLRIEELLNAFSFAYSGESAGMEKREQHGEAQAALNADIEIAPAPWAPEHTLLRVGIQARKAPQTRRAAERFLILADLEGGLSTPRDQEMLRDALRSLVTRLRPDDEVRLAWRHDGRLLVGEARHASDKWELLSQIDDLGIVPAGHVSTEELPAALARSSRILVCSSGQQPLPAALEGSRLPLSVLAWGSNPAPSEAIVRLSGRSSFRVDWADSPGRARALLLEQAGEGSQVVARGARMELRFNPGAVAAYRLIGYEDHAGSYSEALPSDLVSGQSFTALYEIVPAGQRVPEYNAGTGSLSYKAVPSGRASQLGAGQERELFHLSLDFADTTDERRLRRVYRVLDGKGDWNRASEDFRLAASVAGFGMILRDSPYRGKASLTQLATWAGPSGGSVPATERREFLQLVREAEKLGYR